MSVSDITSRRLYNQCITQTTFKTPGDAVKWLGAIQAQDYLGSLWAVGLRLRNPTETAIEQAIADKTIVRTWPMRGTIHYVPAADVRWMLKLLTPRILARNAKRLLQNYGLDQAVLSRSKDLLIKNMQGGRRLARDAMYKVLEAAHIPTAGQRGLQILWWLAQEQVICFGPRQGKQPTFVLLDEWLPATKTLGHEEALAELARRYFTSHGPATLQDLAWWSGLAMADAKSGLEMVKSELKDEVMDGKTYWFAESRMTRKTSTTNTHLLPNYDEYIVGYTDRSTIFDASHTKRLDARGDILANHSIVIDGRIVGIWRRTLTKNAVVIESDLFTPLTRAQKQSFSEAAKRYGAFLGLPVVLAK